MFLSASEIQAYVDSGEIKIAPFDPSHLKPASYVLQLSNRWRQWSGSNEPVDIFTHSMTDKLFSSIVTSEEHVLSKNVFCLGATIEKISLPVDMVAIVTPLSHIARWGLYVNLGSLYVSPGYGETAPSELTLEIASQNPSPLILRAGLPICHIAFTKIKSENKYLRLSRSVYEGLETPSIPLLNEEWNQISWTKKE